MPSPMETESAVVEDSADGALRPSFLIAGERRCGTTFLADLLRRHPDIFLHPKSDKAWFVDDAVRRPDGAGPPWEETHRLEDYLRWFAEAGATPTRTVGEKSADYLFWDPAHARIARLLPGVRLVVLLRDPVARAWSHYWNEIVKRRERLGFEEAVAREEERSGISPWHRYNFSYLARGDYAASLDRLYRHIPPERVLVTVFEELRHRPEPGLAAICRFLGVDDGLRLAPSSEARNANWAVVPRPWAARGPRRRLAEGWGAAADWMAKRLSRDRYRRREWAVRLRAPFFFPARRMRMPPEVERRLRAHFRPRIARLEELLGRRLELWRR